LSICHTPEGQQKLSVQMSKELRSAVREMLARINCEQDIQVKDQLQLKLRKVLGEQRYRSVMGLPPDPNRSVDEDQGGTASLQALQNTICSL
jgi:hypothetical protein